MRLPLVRPRAAVRGGKVAQRLVWQGLRVQEGFWCGGPAGGGKRWAGGGARWRCLRVWYSCIYICRRPMGPARTEEHRSMGKISLAAAPPGAGLDGFDWRISCARVASGGPFSVFPGVDRQGLVAACARHHVGEDARHQQQADQQ